MSFRSLDRWCGHTSRPHPEERGTRVSKDGPRAHRGNTSLVDQTAVERRQELVVEDVGSLRPLLKLEIFRDLVDRAFEARRIDRADAVAFHFAGQDVVAQDALQAFEFEVL